MAQRNRRRRTSSGSGGRDAGDGTQWIYGLHAARAVLENPARRIHRVLLTRNAGHEVQDLLARTGLTPTPVGPDALSAALPPGAVHQGIAVAAEPLPETDLETLCAEAEAREEALLVALDQVSDPQNVGSVLRTAAAFGAIGVIVTRRNAPPVTGVLAKAASGALETVPLVAVPNLARALDQLGDSGFLRVGLSGDAERLLSEVRAQARLALVLGAEGSGMRRLTRERCDVLAKLPTRPLMPHLNVAAAASAVLYEFARSKA